MNNLEYFNLTHISLLLIAPILTVLLFFMFIKKRKLAKNILIYILIILTIGIYIFYKIVKFKCLPDIKIIDELPLYLCSLNLLFMPYAILTKDKLFFSYFYFCTTITNTFSLIFFPTFLLSATATELLAILYFLFIALNITIGLLFVLFRYYKPSSRDIIKANGLMVILVLIIHIFNVIIKFMKLSTHTNYCVTLATNDNPFLNLVYNFLPYPLAYLLPLLIGILLIDILLLTPFDIANKIYTNKKNKEVLSVLNDEEKVQNKPTKTKKSAKNNINTKTKPKPKNGKKVHKSVLPDRFI